MPYRKDRIKKLVGFTVEDWKIVCKKAKASKLRVGTYIRVAAVKGEIRIYELRELIALKSALNSIGSNLNQIARVVNSTGSVYQKDIEEMQSNFKYFKNAIKNYLIEISPTIISGDD